MSRREIKILVSVVLMALGWLANLAGQDMLFDASMVLAAVIMGYDVAKSAFFSLRYGVISINLLVFIAAVGGIYLEEYWESAAVTFLFVFGSYLETKALGRTRGAISALVSGAPEKAMVIREGRAEEVNAEDIEIGDLVAVKPGEKIAADGVIVSGQADIDESTITGESMPVFKSAGDKVYTATMALNGYIEVKAERVKDDTMFSKIIYLIEKSQEKKAETQRFIEKFSQYYTPGIMLASLAAYIITRDLRFSITFLVIACPGALVISTPVTIVSAIGNAASNGILVKGGETLEKAANIKAVAFDKTGTLTAGRPAVAEVKGFGTEEGQALYIAASAEMYSEHPLAAAITEFAGRTGVIPHKPEDFTVWPGRGVIANLDGEDYAVGNRKLMEETGITMADEADGYISAMEDKGYTLVLIGKIGKKSVIGAIAARDELKTESAYVIKRLKDLGIKTYMLTGDNERVAGAIAGELGMDGFYAGLMPDEKLKIIGSLKEKGKTAMVGDGINDAASLAEADVGIAVKGAADISTETADAVMMSESLVKLLYFINLSKAAVRNLKVNIGFSIFVVTALLLGVIMGDVFMATGMFFHEASVIIVVLNGMRLIR